MGIIKRLFNRDVTVSKYKLVSDMGNNYYGFDGKIYESDIIRSCIRPKAQAVGKALGKHIRKTIKDNESTISENPVTYIKFLLEEPNPYMTGQLLQEKMTTQLQLNNNAFALIQRDNNNLPCAIYPIAASMAEAIQDSTGELYLRFTYRNGEIYTFKYTDIIHLRKDFNEDDIFGTSPARAITSLMNIVTTTDQGIVKAIKNSNVVKWLLQFKQTLRPEDIKKNTKQFVDDYLKADENSETVGAAATDAKFDAKQVDPKDYVPNAPVIDRTTERIYSFFNTNKDIVQSSYTENQWISYYEAEIEPVIIQLSGEYSRKIFSRRERGFGNSIVFESNNLTFVSMTTKLQLVQYVDRGIMNPDELREILNMAPIPNGLGQQYIRRLDTAVIESKGGDEDEKD